MKLLYGEEILQYMPVVYNIIIVTVLSTIVSFLNILFTIFRKLVMLVIINGGAAIITLILCCFFIPRYDIQGANYALLFVYLIQILYMIWMFIRFYIDWQRSSVNKTGK